MPRVFVPMLLVAALFGCDQSTHFRQVQVDGLPRCTPPGRLYERPLCIEVEGDDIRGRYVVSDGEQSVDLPDRSGEWTFRLGRCEHPRDLSRTRYECGECQPMRSVTRSIGPGPGRHVSIPAPGATDCLPAE